MECPKRPFTITQDFLYNASNEVIDIETTATPNSNLWMNAFDTIRRPLYKSVKKVQKRFTKMKNLFRQK